MTILKVLKSRKHQHLIVTDECEFLLDDDTVDEHKLKAGIKLNAEQVKGLKLHSDCTRALSKASWLLSQRDYTEKGLFDKLKPDYCDYAVRYAIGQLKSVGAIDDVRYAKTMSEYYAEYKNLSKRAIKTELIKKGVSKETAEICAEDVEYNEIEAAIQIIRQKYPTFSDNETVDRRMTAALLRRGFSYQDIKQAKAYIIEGEQNGI